MFKELKFLNSILQFHNTILIVSTIITICLIILNFFVPSDGFAQFTLTITFVYWITYYTGFQLVINKYKIAEFLYVLPKNIEDWIRRDLFIVIFSNIGAYILWSFFLVGTDRIFMMIPLLYMISISIFSSVLIISQKYLNTRFNEKFMFILNMSTLIFFLVGYMPVQNLYDRGMINQDVFFFTWLPFIILALLTLFVFWINRYLRKHARSKHMLWSD
ncbi:hypothetical protein ETI06_07880 [Macrococcoides goetzii]|nr:hypothetical protein [Macrococcus goetzii]TDM42259.1 hypothetical protein ETI10_03955 [Macrococcus goetzii]TDM47806.1 hypothetical protein ETI08_01345 [Macrococcus goetzii]TDM48938.1 hypothetical protein ETI06_07880 [Macrococcus goetzii]